MRTYYFYGNETTVYTEVGGRSSTHKLDTVRFPHPITIGRDDLHPTGA